MKVIIIGGGASGVLNALYLKKLNKNLKVTILEKNDRILKKLMKTGNGRCNISNSNMNASFYNNYEFIDKLYTKLPPENVIEYFNSIGLLTKNDSSSRLYPYSESAKTVIDVLRSELDSNGIEVLCDEEVIDISRERNFTVKTKTNVFHSDYVVIAAGSIAQEKTEIYSLMNKINHRVTKTEPGLVALKVKENLKSLQGIRVKCRASVINNGKNVFSEEGELLFKENGISGVLVLNLSRYAKVGSIVSLDLFSDYPSIDEYILSFINDKSILDILSGILPKMLALYIVKECNDDLYKVLKMIHNLEFVITGDYGFNQGQIVLGGVDLKYINNDFSSKEIDGLYIIGELLDIDGSSGGYNLHFAWTSGIISAISIFEKNL